jgi:flagellin
MRLGHHLASMQTARHLQSTRSRTTKSLARLASGRRIVSAADDAAGLAVATNLETRARSLDIAMRNTNDGLSILQTAESAVSELIDINQLLMELGVQSASETLPDTERQFIQDEADALFHEMDRIVGTTEFNGVKLLDGSAAGLEVQVGIDNTANDRIALPLLGIDPNDITAFPQGTTYSFSSVADARTNLEYIQEIHLPVLNRYRSRIGALHNRLTSALDHTMTHREALTAASSRILDTDYANETTELAKSQLLESAGMAAHAQAKNLGQNILALLQ